LVTVPPAACLLLAGTAHHNLTDGLQPGVSKCNVSVTFAVPWQVALATSSFSCPVHLVSRWRVLPILNSRRAELPDNPRLVSQLCQLERHAGSAKDAIRHPPGSHDDIANSTAGAIVMALQVAATEVTSFHVPFDFSRASLGPMPGDMGDSWSNHNRF
jgi:hypothetical protein